MKMDPRTGFKSPIVNSKDPGEPITRADVVGASVAALVVLAILTILAVAVTRSVS